MDSEVLRLVLLDDGTATTSMSSLLPSKPRDSVGSNGSSFPSSAAAFLLSNSFVFVDEYLRGFEGSENCCYPIIFILLLESISKLCDDRAGSKQYKISRCSLIRLTRRQISIKKTPRNFSK
jgi:hypothetical protein